MLAIGAALRACDRARHAMLRFAPNDVLTQTNQRYAVKHHIRILQLMRDNSDRLENYVG